MRQTIFPSLMVPRHYLQIAHDFEKLLVKIEQSSHLSPSTPMTVSAPVMVFADWDEICIGHQRALPQIFRVLSERVLVRSCGLSHVQTVRCLVPLEQRVYQLLSLREMILRHTFSGEWQRGQGLLLLRLDKVIMIIKRILAFFITAVQGRAAHHAAQELVWETGFGCPRETRAFLQWFHAMQGSISLLAYPRQSWRFFWQSMGLRFRFGKGACRLPQMPFMLLR